MRSHPIPQRRNKGTFSWSFLDTLKLHETVEIDPPTARTSVHNYARRRGIRISQFKTTTGKLKITRIK
jgi:hypothetical protein